MEPRDPERGPIARLIAGSARNPWLTLLLVAALAVWGWLAIGRSPLDAIPDLSDVQVIVFTEWEGQSPDLVEDQITYPITSALLSAPRVQYVRGQSMFGMSFVYAIFDDGTDIYWARSRVLEYLNEVQGRLPAGVNPTLGPDATGVGWVFQYALVDTSGRHDLQQLRSLQDFTLKYALESVPGVAEVASIGGFVKEYQILLDPDRLQSLRIPLHVVIQAVRESNQDAGGQVVELAEHEFVVRGRGYVASVEDLRSIPLRVDERGVPVMVGDVAQVKIGPASRRGFAELDGEGEVVGGIVIMRYGENALDVIRRAERRLEEVKRGLPEGVEVVVTYDRSGLIEASVATLRHTLIEEIVVVSVVIFLFLMHARSALVPILTLPVAVLLSFIPMMFQGLTINIMSLGGIAVAIGAMVDASIILIENVHKRLEEWERQGRDESGAEGGVGAGLRAGPSERLAVQIRAMQEVGPAVFFSLLVITVSFLPVFTLQGVEGRLFRPLAFTKTYSMGFAALLAVTLTPALVALFIRGRIRGEERNPLNRWLIAAYAPVVRFVVRHRKVVVVLALLGVAATVPAFLALDNEFMPPLNEGVVLYMPTAPPGMSSTEAMAVLQSMDARLRQFPEVVRVFGKMGRAETATDPAPIGMAETVVVLKPRAEWRPGLSWDELIAEMDEALQYPGMPNIWWMPIQTRTEMLSTGIRSPLGIKIFGDDLETIERTAIDIEGAVAGVAGTRSAYADRSTGGFYLDVTVDRLAAARHGLRVADVNDLLRMAVGGMAVSETVEGRERYPISVQYARDFRQDPADLGRLLVPTPTGAQVPLAQVARIETVTGPPMIRSEDGKLVGYVFVDTGERAIAEYVEEARQVVAETVALPAGTRIEWAGQFTYFERAKARLKLVVPVTLFLIALLLWLNTRSLAEVAIIVLAVPFSLIGAIWLLWALDYNMSVAVWVGLIALAGLDAETGVVMLLYLKLAHRRWAEGGRLRRFRDLEQAIVEGAAHRIRPKLMTVMTTTLALLPVMWSTGTGAEVMRRIAAPMVGGLATSFLLELTVYPAIFALWKGRSLARAVDADEVEAAA
ncbi:MAG TPA: CusA/CzcA family heavy metal efflux RND transporter [Thermoanaerobaculia bacterium]|nr:CusA/CzcA family heavy metal efflux RND transporter [Thermoanaerobaculia bacterium]